MRIKTGLLSLVTLLALPAYSGQVIPNESAVAAVYKIAFYNEPSLITNGDLFCFTFTTDGSVHGYPRSGTFTDGGGDWTGTWYQNGDEVMLTSSLASDGNEAIAMFGKLDGPGNAKISGRYLDTDPTSAGFETSGTFIATKSAAACPTAGAKPTLPKG